MRSCDDCVRVNVKLPADLHHRLRVFCVSNNTSVQQFVVGLIEHQLDLRTKEEHNE